MPLPVAALDGGWVAEPGKPPRPFVPADLREPRRWVWWSAESARPLVEAGEQVAACWDLAAVHRLLHGGRRDHPGAVEAAMAGVAPPPLPDEGLTLLASDLSLPAEERTPAERAVAALAAQEWQLAALGGVADPRAGAAGTPLAVLTAYAESAAALLGIELETYGLPLSVEVAAALLEETVGPPGTSSAARDAAVLEHFDGSADLRNPLSVRDLLARNRIDVPDTRSWRLEPLASHPGVAALLAWRKVERIATTYGWAWLAANVREGRLRGRWEASDGAGGRMTASAGLHNLPAELRRCIVADPGWVLVRADLGQVEPRVLAVVSGDPAFAAATQADDLYAPVATALGADRPTAKVAVLAAMYGQRSGAAGAALQRMERTYPRAIAVLSAAEDRGRRGLDVRTWGGRVVPMGGVHDGGDSPRDRSRGRYARNAVIQGAAAELFKAWAVTVRAGLPALGGRIVLCLHDELLLHVPAAHAAAAEDLLHASLASTAAWWAAGAGVRFVAVTSAAESWADAKD